MDNKCDKDNTEQEGCGYLKTEALSEEIAEVILRSGVVVDNGKALDITDPKETVLRVQFVGPSKIQINVL